MAFPLRPALAVAVFGALTAGCAPYPDYAYRDRGYSTVRHDTRYYDRDRDDYERRVCASCGEVADIDRVRLRSGTSGGGAVLGAIIGGLLGNTVGRGDGRQAATVAGAVAGGFVGNAAERDSNGGYGREAWRITVNLDDGRWAEVVQSDPGDLRRGDRVVVRNDRVVRTR
jgi:outer membrane lipoprotein SlyB